MKFKLNKSVTLNWRKPGVEDKVDVYEIRAGVFTPDLPEDVGNYLLENYKDNILTVDDATTTKLPVKEIVAEIKATAPEKEKEFEVKEAIKNQKPTGGLKLADVAKLA